MGYKDTNGHYWELDDSRRLTLAQLKSAAVDLRNEPDGVEIRLDNGLTYKWVQASTLDGDDMLVVVPSQGIGRFVLAPGSVFDLPVAIDHSVADATDLVTLPPGCMLHIGRCYWEVTTSFTGGTSSTIGISSDTAPHNTKGDLLGGSGGDDSTTLAAGDPAPGTVGADYAGGITLLGGTTVRFDRITSAFTAGAGYAHVVGQVLQNTGG